MELDAISGQRKGTPMPNKKKNKSYTPSSPSSPSSSSPAGGGGSFLLEVSRFNDDGTRSTSTPIRRYVLPPSLPPFPPFPPRFLHLFLPPSLPFLSSSHILLGGWKNQPTTSLSLSFTSYSTNLSLPPSLLPSLPLSPSTAPAASSLEVGKTNRPPPPYVGTWNVCCLWLVIAQSGAWGIHAKKEEEEEEEEEEEQQQQLFWTPRREGGREGGREGETSAAEFVSFPSGYGAIVVSC